MDEFVIYIWLLEEQEEGFGGFGGYSVYYLRDKIIKSSQQKNKEKVEDKEKQRRQSCQVGAPAQQEFIRDTNINRLRQAASHNPSSFLPIPSPSPFPSSILSSLFENRIYSSSVLPLQQQNIVVVDRMQVFKSSPKKLYQYILSTKEPSQLLRDSLSYLLRKAVESNEHFDFLLHRVNWFQAPFTHFQPLFLKILRIYRTQSKQASRVTYNLLVEAFTSPTTNEVAIKYLIELFQESYDKKIILQCLKENYPHKLCGLETHMLYLGNMLRLCRELKDYRMDFLEIIIENLVNFDTELVLADEWVHKPFPEDEKIKMLRDQCHQSELSQKFDHLLSHLLGFFNGLAEDEQIMGEILLVFQNKVLPIKTTKLIQFFIFNIAESSKIRAKAFISFLLGNIFEANHKENFYRIFTQSNFYLFSYILRSKRLPNSSINKTLKLMMGRLREKLEDVQESEINDRTNLKQLYLKNELLLIMLQTIIITKISHSSQEDLFLNEQYKDLLDLCSKKLHFEYFLKEQVLQRVNIDKKDNKKNLTVKYSNKFLPATLPKVGGLIDESMRFYEMKGISMDLKEFDSACRKLHKGQVPTSNCSTVV